MEELLYQYNPWWEQADYHEPLEKRTQYFEKLVQNLTNRSIIFLTGLRRVGKTTLMKLLITYLLEQGTDPKHIFFISLDDYAIKDTPLRDILTGYRKIHGLSLKQRVYVFFDEVTYMHDYHQQLKNIYDKEKVKLVASSSSASLLRDKKAYLTGRAITYEVKPLDFEEYLQFKGIVIKKSEPYLLETHFQNYMKEGGMPEHVLNPSREYLMGLVNDIIQKDIIAYKGLRNRQVIQDYFTLLMERSGKQLSINKIAHILGISTDTASRYLGYFEETYLIHLLPQYGKTNTSILRPKKIYACDLGIKHLFVGERDLGSYFENYIYLLLRNNKELFYLNQQGSEIDFITSDGIVIESKYNSAMNKKQQALFNSVQAKEKHLIDSVEKLQVLQKFRT